MIENRIRDASEKHKELIAIRFLSGFLVTSQTINNINPMSGIKKEEI